MCIRMKLCCCGCCTLQTGTKIIGWIHLLSGFSTAVLNATTISLMTSIESNQFEEYYTCVVKIVLSVIWIAVSIPLLIAASKKSRPGLFLPWLIFHFLTVISGLGYGLFFSIAVILPADFISGIVFITICLFGLGIGVYFRSVIYSYYLDLIELSTNEITSKSIPSNNCV